MIPADELLVSRVPVGACSQLTNTLMEENAKSREHGALQREELEGMRGEISSSQGPQPISMLSRTEPPSSLERQGEDEPDKKPLPVVRGGVDKVAGLGENRHGFAYAVESVKPEDLPEFVKQHDNTLFFPEKVRNCR